MFIIIRLGRDLSASASRMLGLKVHTTTSTLNKLFLEALEKFTSPYFTT